MENRKLMAIIKEEILEKLKSRSFKKTLKSLSLKEKKSKIMEKAPEIRIVGKASSEKKEEARKEIEEALFSHFRSLTPEEQELMEKLEYPKSEKEIAIINFANQLTSQLMKEAGRDPYDIPLENFHLLPPELYEKMTGRGTTGTASLKRQGILLNAGHCRGNPLLFASTVFHELLHLKAHFSLEVEEENQEVKKSSYREGVRVMASQRAILLGRPHQHFAGLEEAIVSEAEKKFLEKFLELPELKKEKEWLDSQEAKELKRKISEKEKIPQEEIVWVFKEGDWVSFSYFSQREVLKYVCTEIQKEFPERFSSPEEVFKIFLNANFTGRLLELARLVEKTFGKGSFRVLSNMSTDKESAVLCLETLEKFRAHVQASLGEVS